LNFPQKTLNQNYSIGGAFTRQILGAFLHLPLENAERFRAIEAVFQTLPQVMMLDRTILGVKLTKVGHNSINM